MMDDSLQRMMAERMREAFDRHLDAVYGTTQTVATPAPVLTLAGLQRTIDAITTDRRTIIARDLRPFRKVPGWTLERAKGERGWWFRATTGPYWRIKVHRATYYPPPKGSVYVVDPTFATSPKRVGVGNLLTTVTALALAGVDEKVGV